MKVQNMWGNIRKYHRLQCQLLYTRSCFSSCRIFDSDAEDCSDVPEGYLAVYVGSGRIRYLVKTEYLNHKLFRELLEKSEEEFGYEHNGGLTIHCEVEDFESLMWELSKSSKSDLNLSPVEDRVG